MTPRIPRTFVALKLGSSIHAASARAKIVLRALTDNPSIFVAPDPPLVVLAADIDVLDRTATDALDGSKAAVEARRAQQAVVMRHLYDAKAYVEKVANADPPNAAAIVVAGGFAVRRPIVRIKQPLTARQGASSGTVMLTAKAAARKAIYCWQWSLDQKAWTDLPHTQVARTRVNDLTAGAVHSFRVRAYTASTGFLDWSEAVTLLVR